MIHKKMDAWKLSMDLVIEIYKLTRAYPADEKLGLSQQMRRAAVSVPSNIAEGAARKSTGEFIQFLYISLGSLSELETQLEISKRLGYNKVEPEKLDDSCTRIRQMILGIIRHLKT
jgi:four helix bundle protein